MSDALVDHRLTSNEVWQIEQVCDEFEEAWKAGQCPKLESFLRHTSGRLRESLLLQLLPLELEYRFRAGELPRPAEIEMRFPQVTNVTEQIEAARREAFSVSSATNGGSHLLPERLADYRLVRIIGRGGMGIVYEAVHEQTEQRVALKMLGRMSLADSIARERFRREAEATSQLSHPNIVQVFEVGEFQGQPFLALEYVAGPSLAEHWKHARQSPREAAELVEQLAHAIQHAHEKGIVHRDLKPSNVLISPDRPKITDFGLAHHIEGGELTITGEIVGTPDYMAPEQALGKCSQRTIGKAADIYALGAILYSALTGRPPFQGTNALEALELVRSQEPVLPSRIEPAIPFDLETICLKCLEKDPLRRYGSAEALADDLRRFLSGEAVTARRAGQVERVRRWCRRNPVAAVGSVLGLIALLFAVGFASSHSVLQQLRHEQKQTKSALKDVQTQKKRAEDNAQQLAEQQKLTQQALVEAKRFRRQAEELSTSLSMERGLALLEQGDVARGMLLLGHCLQIAPAEDQDLHRVIRSNLAAVHRQLPLQLHAVLEHRGEVRAAAFSPDGSCLLAGGRNSKPQLWDVATGQPIGKPLPHDGELKAVAFSHDGKFFITAGTDKTVRLWNAETREPIGKPLPHPQHVHSVALSLNDKLLVTGCNDGTTTMWDLPTATKRQEWKQLGSVHAIAFSPNGKQFVTGNAMRRAQVWDAETGEPFGETMMHPGEVLSVAFRPDGLWIVTGCEEGTALFWDALTGKPAGFPILHRGPVRAVGYSSDGKTLWTGGAYGLVRLWDAATMTALSTPIHHQSVVHSVIQSADGRHLATGSADGALRIWVKPELPDRNLVIPHKHLVYCLALSPDGNRLVSGTAEPTAQIWDAATGSLIGKPLAHKSSIMDVAISPDGQKIVTGSTDNTAQLWSITGEPIGTPMQHNGHVYSVTFTPDSETVITGCKDNTLRWWNAKTGAPLGDPVVHPDWVHAVACSADGETIVTGCEDGAARFWNAKTREPIGTPIQHRGPVKSLAFSPDSSKLITGTWDDRTARLWDVQTREPIGPPLPHQEHVMAVAFSRDGKTIATGAWDGAARLWDVATGRALGPPLVHQYTIRDLAFSPDDKQLWTAAFDRTIKAWELTPPTTGEVDHVVTWLQVLSGLELDSDGVFRELDADEWHARRDQLKQRGGPPRSISDTPDSSTKPARSEPSS